MTAFFPYMKKISSSESIRWKCRVGGGAGTGTDALCARLATAYPTVEISAGGGVRGAADLRRLRECGVLVALVASALHDGALTAADLPAPSAREGTL